MSDIKDWSQTAAGNNAAPPDGWPEGMAPSNVNNCARENMAAIARWYNNAEWIDKGHVPIYVSATRFNINGVDVSAIYEVGRRVKLVGTMPFTLYGIITVSTYNSPNTEITVDIDGGANLDATLNAVNLGILGPNSGYKPSIDEDDFSSDSEAHVPTQQSTKAYIASQILDEDDLATNSSIKAPSQQSTKAYVASEIAAVWPYGVPVAFMIDTLPAGWIKADGTVYNISTYPNLAAVLGNTYGGDGISTFAVPDLRGYFLRGHDDGAGNDPDATSRTDRGDGTTGDEVGTKQADEFKSHNHRVVNAGVDSSLGSYVDRASAGGVTLDSSVITASGGNETRPKNIAVCYAFRAG